MAPVPVAPFAIPVEVDARPEREEDRLAPGRALVVLVGVVDQAVADCGRTHRCASQLGVLSAHRESRLSERVSPVVCRVVVAVVIGLNCRLIPPLWLIQRCAPADAPLRPLASTLRAVLISPSRGSVDLL